MYGHKEVVNWSRAVVKGYTFICRSKRSAEPLTNERLFSYVSKVLFKVFSYELRRLPSEFTGQSYVEDYFSLWQAKPQLGIQIHVVVPGQPINRIQVAIG
jgi:hypothetical protein